MITFRKENNKWNAEQHEKATGVVAMPMFVAAFSVFTVVFAKKYKKLKNANP